MYRCFAKRKNVFLNKSLKCCGIFIFIFCSLNSASVSLFNNSKPAGFFDVNINDWFDRDVLTLPLDIYKQSGIYDINKVSIFSWTSPSPKFINYVETLMNVEKLKKDIKSQRKIATYDQPIPYIKDPLKNICSFLEPTAYVFTEKNEKKKLLNMFGTTH